MSSTLPVLTVEVVRSVMMSPRKTEMLYELMNLFHETSKEFGITYWAVGGTLLGAVREKGVILWDDDLDVTVLESQRQQVEAMLVHITTTHKNYSYREFIWHRNKGWKLEQSTNDIYASIDIFISDRFTDNELSSTPYFYNSTIDSICKNTFPADLFIESDLFLPDGKLKEVPFGKNTIFTPADPIPYLNRKYKNWDTIIHVFNHYRHSPASAIKYSYSLEMLYNILDLCRRDTGGSI